MIKINEKYCPICKNKLKYYDSVKRIVKTKSGKTKKIVIRRLRCSSCKSLHRELPGSILPYKEYESEIIMGVIEGLITPETLGYEDYPCEMTMHRWMNEKNRLLKIYF